MTSEISSRFLELFKNSDAIEIDEVFLRYYDASVENSDDDNAIVIFLCYDVAGEEEHFSVTKNELDSVYRDDGTGTWFVGIHEIRFYTVSQITM